MPGIPAPSPLLTAAQPRRYHSHRSPHTNYSASSLSLDPWSPHSFKSICLVSLPTPLATRPQAAGGQGPGAVRCRGLAAQRLAGSPVFTTDGLRRKEKGIPWGRGESHEGRKGLPLPRVPHPRADHKAQAGPGHFSLLGTRGWQQPLFQQLPSSLLQRTRRVTSRDPCPGWVPLPTPALHGFPCEAWTAGRGTMRVVGKEGRGRVTQMLGGWGWGQAPALSSLVSRVPVSWSGSCKAWEKCLWNDRLIPLGSPLQAILPPAPQVVPERPPTQLAFQCQVSTTQSPWPGHIWPLLFHTFLHFI